MIQTLKRLLHLETYEESLRGFANTLEELDLLKAEIDVMAKAYLSTAQDLRQWGKTEKQSEVLELIKSQQDGLTSRYLSFLADKHKELTELEKNKASFISKYPHFEKALLDLKKSDFVEKTLLSYRLNQLTLEECDVLIKAATKDKVLYSDNIVFNTRGEILIEQRAPLDENGPNLWCLPGGHIQIGESHEVGAKRELREETGYEIDECHSVGVFDDDKVHIEYFMSMVDTDTQSPTVHADETRYTEFVPVADLYKYPTIYNMWDRVYSILGIEERVSKIKKAMAEGFVKSEKANAESDKRIAEAMHHKDEVGVGAEKRKKLKPKEKFHTVMKEWKAGTLHSGGGGEIVKDRKQAIAIALAESGQSKEKAMSDIIHGGDADNKSLEDIAKHHKVDIEDIAKEYKLGLSEEKEHADDEEKRCEIAKDHLWKDPKYYTKLKTIEKSDMSAFEKAKQLGHLVPKKVQIKGKDGKIHFAIRWINPKTGEAEQYVHGLKETKKVTGANFEETVANVVANNEISRADKVRNLIDLGVYDKKLLTLLTGETSTDFYFKSSDINLKDLPNNSEAVLAEVRKEQKDNDTPDERAANDLLRDGVTVDDLWNIYEKNLKRVITGRHKFALVYGTGGVGKSYTFDQLAEQFELREYNDEIQPSKEQYDYVRIGGGKITPTQVYAEMYRHRDKLIVFDDCDSVLSTDDVMGFLKGGLDTGERTQVSNHTSRKIYNIEGDPESGTIPNTFSFKGRVIAITNLTAQQIDQAVRSRSMCVNLTMTIDETVERLTKIKDKIPIWSADKTQKFEVSQEARDYAFGLLVAHKEKLGNDINTRIYSNAVLIAQDGIEENTDKEDVRKEIVAGFNSVRGSFDQMLRQIKGKGR